MALANEGRALMARWKTAFVAVSALLGEPIDAVRASLDGDAELIELLLLLQKGTREARARAIASYLAPVVEEVEAVRLA